MVNDSDPLMKAANEYFDSLVKSRFIELFGDPIGNPKGWKTKTILEVAPSVQNDTPAFDEGNWLLNLDAVESQSGVILFKNRVPKEQLNGSIMSFSKDNVLYSKLRPYLNKVVLPDEDGFGTSELIPLLPDSYTINKVYLASYLRSNSVVSFLSGAVAGTKMPRVSMSSFWKMMVPLPPIDLQIQFATFVEQVDKSKLAFQKLVSRFDELVKSRFIELFGECGTIPLIDVANITMGQSPESSTYNDNGSGVPFYQGKTEFTDLYISKKTYCSEPKKMAKGMDILMSVRAPVGAVNITQEDCCIGRGLAAISPKKDVVDLFFLFVALHMKENEIADMGTGSTFKAINKADMERITVPNADYSDQLIFSTFFQQVDKSKSEIIEGLKRLTVENNSQRDDTQA